MKRISFIFCALALLAGTGCNEASQQTTTTRVETEPVEPPEPSIRLVLSISAREVAVMEGADTLRKYPIAVGKAKNPTPTGEFKIHQIDFNPDWTPPDSEWSKDEEYTPPGHPDNPMGRARIIYQMPYTLHGTKDLKSLGKAQSHGSVRMANTDVIELAKLIMERSGTEKPADWFERVLADSTKMESVKLENPIPLTNRQ
jgi:lipoprotein-anchoring transpeptidase ErfK/SrfK